MEPREVPSMGQLLCGRTYAKDPDVGKEQVVSGEQNPRLGYRPVIPQRSPELLPEAMEVAGEIQADKPLEMAEAPVWANAFSSLGLVLCLD